MLSLVEHFYSNINCIIPILILEFNSCLISPSHVPRQEQEGRHCSCRGVQCLQRILGAMIPGVDQTPAETRLRLVLPSPRAQRKEGPWLPPAGSCLGQAFLSLACFASCSCKQTKEFPQV